MYFGSTVTANTVAAGAPFSDGYIYVYGCEDKANNARWLLVARVPEAQFTSFSAWRYWNGSALVAGIDQAKGHPHLSAPGEMLVSYSVNTFDVVQFFQQADISPAIHSAAGAAVAVRAQMG